LFAPGIKGVSENIRVHTVIDRFLEHAGGFSFQERRRRRSILLERRLDPRNFRRRVEVCFRLDDGLKQRISKSARINARRRHQGWLLRPTGTYER